jgi:hypothetical protein
MITLLDNLKMLQEKTAASVFKERTWVYDGSMENADPSSTTLDVLPLVYNALESEHAVVCDSFANPVIQQAHQNTGSRAGTEDRPGPM